MLAAGELKTVFSPLPLEPRQWWSAKVGFQGIRVPTEPANNTQMNLKFNPLDSKPPFQFVIVSLKDVYELYPALYAVRVLCAVIKNFNHTRYAFCFSSVHTEV